MSKVVNVDDIMEILDARRGFKQDHLNAIRTLCEEAPVDNVGEEGAESDKPKTLMSRVRGRGKGASAAAD